MGNKIFAKTEGIVAGLAVVIILEFLTYFIYINALAAQKGEIFEGLYRTTRVIQTLIDPEKHRELSHPDQENSALYTHQIDPLYNALNADSTIEFIYTMIQVDTTVHFILDPTPAGNFDTDSIETKSHVMDVYDTPIAELKECFNEQKPTITHEVYYDQWGGHISCFTPLFDQQKFIGVLGVDISTETYNARLQPIKKATQRAMITIFFIAYLSGLIIWFLRRLYKSLIL